MAGVRADDVTESERQGWLGLPSLGRVIVESLGDLRAAAGFLRRVLPDIAEDLKSIHGHIATMDPEMAGMSASVQRIEVEMGALSARIGELGERMREVEEAVARLEPHVADVNLAVRPLKRARARFPGR
jgi:hypothetical protein